MTQIRILTALCAGILLWTTCTTDHNNSDLLSNAIHTVDNNPQEALALLESISPELYDSDKDQYMQYLVILTQARYMNDQDITGDSLILDAQRSFAQSRNYEMAARASYYAAIYWYEGEANDKAAEYWQAAFQFAEQADNNLFLLKSAYALGMSYYNQDQWEEALPYCQKAWELCKDESAERNQFSIMNMLGHIYREQKDFEQAYLYFDNGLEAAKKRNNTKYESRFLRNKGIIHWEKKEYRQAKEYFDLALSKQPEPEDRMRVYLSYAKLYRDINRPDSTHYYLNTIESQIPEITYPDTRRDIYTELVIYYKANQGDGEKIALYSQLAHTEDLRIHKIQSDKKIEAINQQLEQLKQKKQIEGKTYRRIFDFGLVTLLILASLLVIAWFNRRGLKEKYAQIKEKYIQTEKEYTQIQEKYIKTNADYIQATKEYIQIKEQYLQVEKECSQTKEEYLQAKDEFIQKKEKYTQAIEEYTQIKEKNLQTEKEYTQVIGDYTQIKEEYEQTKKKYILTDTEYTTLKLEYARAKEKYEQIESKYRQISNQQFNLKLDHMYLSEAGLKSIAKSVEDLYQKKLAYKGSQVWEQLLMLREKFSEQFAGYAKLKIAKLQNGEAALRNLTPGYLAIIQLTSMKYPEEEVARMLGYRSDTEESLQLHKKQIRQILVKAEMTDEDIKYLLPEKK